VAVTGAAQAEFGYDGDGRRIWATTGITTTVFVGSYFEWNAALGEGVSYYYAGAIRLAMRTGSQAAVFFVTDHLGSVNQLVDPYGAPLAGERQLYKPWGEKRLNTSISLTRVGYTGQYDQAEIGLIFYQARWYDANINRWASPDTVIPDNYNALDWDRYQYVRSNPLKYSDPTGQTPWYIAGWDPSYLQLQVGNRCAPPSLAVGISILKQQKFPASNLNMTFPSTYVGIGVTPDAQAEGINGALGAPGITATYSDNGSRQELLNNLKNGIPTVVSIASSDPKTVGHAILAVGYDPATGEFQFFDPAFNDVVDEQMIDSRWGNGKGFTDTWQNGSGNEMNDRLIPPKSMVTLIKEQYTWAPGFVTPGGSGIETIHNYR
jgi:RHS repeat-associated protein